MDPGTNNDGQVVEFYAPWCGHCQNLKPNYEKVAKNLDGLAKVVAIDCDDDSNKKLCGAHGIQGFPTIKTFRPGKKAGGKPIVEDYRGARTATAITEEVVNKINNHVTKVTDQDVDAFLGKAGPKALLFTEKGSTSALLRSIAIDFLDVINVGQVRNKEKGTVKLFGVEKYPTLVLVPEGSDAEPIIYDGELKKKGMVDFLKQAGQPNPDPAPKAKGDGKQKKASKEEKKQTKPTTASDKASESSTETTTTTTKPAAEAATEIPITTISSGDVLRENCLQAASHTCVLALVPSESSEQGDRVVRSLSKLNAKYLHGKRHLFPFFSVSSAVDGESSLRSALGASGAVELVAINARRGWWRQYSGDFGLESVESWIDAIRMGEGAKKTLPKEVLVAKGAEPSTASSSNEKTAESSTATKESSSEETKASEAEEKKAEEKVAHEEL